jgi:hypothetical protein
MLYNAICIYSNGIVISLLGGKLKERGSVKRGKGVRARNKATIGNAQAERSAAEPCENRDAQAKRSAAEFEAATEPGERDLTPATRSQGRWKKSIKRL